MLNQGEKNCGGLGQEREIEMWVWQHKEDRHQKISEEQDLGDQKVVNQKQVSKKSYNGISGVSEIRCPKPHK